MIIDSIDHLDWYKSIHANLARGLELLKADYTGVPDGRYEVDGDRLFYMIQSYETKPVNDLPEAHKKYADIQCVLEGAEIMATGALETLEAAEAHPERDLYLYHAKDLDRQTLVPGRFAVLFPQDAHACAIADGEPAPVHKIVVKVKLAE